MRKVLFVICVIVLASLNNHCAAARPQAESRGPDEAKTSFSQGVRAGQLQNVKMNYVKSLKSDYEGVVESAIFYVVKFKLFYPWEDCRSVIRQLRHLSVAGTTPIIRYKAQLALNFITQPDLLAKVDRQNYKDSEGFFVMLANRLQEHIFALGEDGK